MNQWKDRLIEGMITFLDQMPAEFIVVIMSTFPIIELRGALPLAMSLYDMSFGKAYLLSVLGNMLPVVPLLVLFQPVSQMLRRFTWYAALYDWLYNRTMKKSKQVERYGALGLILFVAVPLPTTGAWTACLAACLFHIRFTYALLAILIGVLTAGIIIGGISFSVFS